MQKFYSLAGDEKAWAKDNNIEINSEYVDEETYRKIMKGMNKPMPEEEKQPSYYELNEGIGVSEDKPKEAKTNEEEKPAAEDEKTEEKKKPEEENKQETALALVVSEIGAEQNKEKQEENQSESEKPALRTENTAIALYSIDKALDFFEKYAEEKGFTFARDPIDDAAAGSFVDADNNEQGRVSVKENNASSDIKGIDALVRYAKETGYDNITLGECSPEYAEEMKKACEKYGIKLMGKDNENIEQNTETNENNQPQLAALPPASEKSNQEEISQPEAGPIPLPAGGQEEITVEESYKITPKIAEARLGKYLREAKTETFDKETANAEAAYSKGWYAATGEEKAFSDILLRKYAIAVVNNEDKSQIEKALQLYGVDTISIEPDNNPEGKVKITGKNFNDRSPEEQMEIKAARDKLLPQKDSNDSGKMQQNQSITRDDGGR